MPVTTAQKKATAKYEKTNYFKTLVRFQKKDEELIRTAAKGNLNGFIVDCVLEKIANMNALNNVINNNNSQSASALNNNNNNDDDSWAEEREKVYGPVRMKLAFEKAYYNEFDRFRKGEGIRDLPTYSKKLEAFQEHKKNQGVTDEIIDNMVNLSYIQPWGELP